jgi:hypothetical protein
MTALKLFLLLQDVVATTPTVLPPGLVYNDNTGRRDVLLAIIAGVVTITVTLGPIIINRWMDRLKAEREAAAATVAAAAAIVAQKVEEVKIAAKATSVGIAALQVTADKTHIIVNSRYDEIREELRKSNENNQRMTELLTKAGILAPKATAPSQVVAEPGSKP